MNFQIFLSKSFFCLIILYSYINTWGASSAPNVYIPVAEGQNITDPIDKNKQNRDPLHLQKITAIKGSYIPTGSQDDIDNFDKQVTYGNHNQRHSQSFANKTNSYWLNPNFQFGPGSVNDFGGDPNAESMLHPFIF